MPFRLGSHGVRDARLRSLARAIEARYPGTEIVFEPAGIPGEPKIRWWMHVLHVRQGDLGPLGDFAIRRSWRLYPGRPVPVVVTPHDRTVTRQFLARMREEASVGPPPRHRAVRRRALRA
jgi:hypothetical protein